ncbi:transmembrane protein [Arabidopsis thaliana]|uniref:Transmembrane protein n=1 Tax=Arabidopsis thaliana TaxID=3702 RepID=B3H670_ARATH|nr:uncharacterized protein AT4G01671 [Arabidopsis thaliana]AEE82060.1 transmembrane protein [Arabidopsis thaliana]|eukprot:NP_001118912.1 transmembrane protein [Arabidopsis thaliana]
MMFWTASSCGLVLVLSLAQILRVRRRLAYAVAGQVHLDQHRRFLMFFFFYYGLIHLN